MSRIPFTEKQAHDLALIWTKTKWEKEFPKITKDADELACMDELFEIYRDAFSYFYGISEDDTALDSEEI